MSDPRRDVAERLEEWAETIVGTGTSSVGHVQQRVNDLREAAALLREPSVGREPDADDLVCRECEAERISLCLDCFDKGGIFGTPSDSPTGASHD